MADKKKILDQIIDRISEIQKGSRNTPVAIKAYAGNTPEFRTQLANEWLDERDMIGQLTRMKDIAEGFAGNPRFVPITEGMRVRAMTDFANGHRDRVNGTILEDFILDSDGAYNRHPAELLCVLNGVPDSQLEEMGAGGARAYRPKAENEIEMFDIDFLK